MIKAEPFLPDEDYDNPARVTDFYEFLGSTTDLASFIKGSDGKYA